MRKNATILMLIGMAGLPGCAVFHERHVEIRAVGAERAMAPDLSQGHALFRRGEYALAMDAYRKVLRRDPSNADAYNGLAVSYAALGRYDISDRFFQLALSFAPKDGKIYRNFARCLEQQGRRDEAQAMLARLDGTSPVSATRPSLAQIAARTPAQPQDIADSGSTRLSRQSLDEVRLDTGKAAATAETGQYSTRITVKIIDQRDEAGPEAGATPVASAADTQKADRAPRVAPHNRKEKEAAADRDLTFLRLWQAMTKESRS